MWVASIDFAGLHEHMMDNKYEADGCLLVAPAYPGSSREEDAAAATRAEQQRISCWTIEQLARFVELAEQKKLTATEVLNIVLKRFSPSSVTEAVDQLLRERKFNGTELYRGIISSLRDLEDKMPHQTFRNIDNFILRS